MVVKIEVTSGGNAIVTPSPAVMVKTQIVVGHDHIGDPVIFIRRKKNGNFQIRRFNCWTGDAEILHESADPKRVITEFDKSGGELHCFADWKNALNHLMTW